MKTITATYPAAPRHERDIGCRIAKYTRALAKFHRHQRELESLRKLNDRMLSDVGVTRDEVSHRNWIGGL